MVKTLCGHLTCPHHQFAALGGCVRLQGKGGRPSTGQAAHKKESVCSEGTACITERAFGTNLVHKGENVWNRSCAQKQLLEFHHLRCTECVCRWNVVIRCVMHIYMMQTVREQGMKAMSTASAARACG